MILTPVHDRARALVSDGCVRRLRACVRAEQLVRNANNKVIGVFYSPLPERLCFIEAGISVWTAHMKASCRQLAALKMNNL